MEREKQEESQNSKSPDENHMRRDSLQHIWAEGKRLEHSACACVGRGDAPMPAVTGDWASPKFPWNHAFGDSLRVREFGHVNVSRVRHL